MNLKKKCYTSKPLHFGTGISAVKISAKFEKFLPSLESDEDWLLESMARLFLHARIYQCSRFFGADVIKTMHLKCPGGCGLRKSKGRSKKIMRKNVKRKRSKISSKINNTSSNEHIV